MKRNPISTLLSVLVIAIVGLSLISVPVAASGVGVWKSTTSYPTNIEFQSCVQWNGFIYCVGGNNGSEGSVTSAVYFAPVSGTGVGVWKSTTSYPTTAEFQSCAASTDGYIYCVGGETTDTASSSTNAVYFASLHSSGVSVWTKTTNYPINDYGQSCAVSGGYIYCVAGYTGSAYTNAVYFAPVSGTGVGAWTSTTSYPLSVNVLSCVLSTGGIFCVGGVNPATSGVYFAPYTHSGVGAWTSTTSYPTIVGYESCVVYGGVIYCVGGYIVSAVTSAVHFAPASHSGVGAWMSTTHNYPTTIVGQSCVLWGHNVYCVGGNSVGPPTSAVYFASV